MPLKANYDSTLVTQLYDSPSDEMTFGEAERTRFQGANSIAWNMLPVSASPLFNVHSRDQLP